MGIISNFIDKSLSLLRLGRKWFNELSAGIIEAGRTISYVETTSPTKADTLHLAIKNSEIRIFMHEFEQVVRYAISQLHLKNVKIGFDTTEDLTWSEDNYKLRPSVYDRPLRSWQFLNVSIVEPYFLPLMSIPYTMLTDLDNLVIDLLRYVRTLPLIIELVLFDRGFYHAHLIDYLNNKKGGKPWPYLMLVPEREAQTNYIQQTRLTGKTFAYYNHVFDYCKDKTEWHPSTTIMVKVVDEKTAWCYATNQEPSLALCLEYPKRWNLETGFRVHDEARIKSKSLELKIRFFYHLIGMLLIILWRLQNSVRYVIFKRFLKEVELRYAQIPEQPPPL
jgi:hypothetical protein